MIDTLLLEPIRCQMKIWLRLHLGITARPLALLAICKSFIPVLDLFNLIMSTVLLIEPLACFQHGDCLGDAFLARFGPLRACHPFQVLPAATRR